MRTVFCSGVEASQMGFSKRTRQSFTQPPRAGIGTSAVMSEPRQREAQESLPGVYVPCYNESEHECLNLAYPR
jgi:hypothetical protein